MITILASGSRGDIEPYIALAQEVKKLGKDVRIATGVSFKDFVQSFDIEFYPLSADYKTVDIDPKLLDDARSSDNPLKMLNTFKKMKKYAAYMTREMYDACKNSELIIYHPGSTIGYFAAKEMDIPCILASPFPMHMTKTIASIITYGRYNLPKSLSYKLLQSMLWMASKGGVSQVIQKPNIKPPFELMESKKHISIISCSNNIFSRPSDWDENIHQYGYWFLDKKEKYIPSKKLTDFLENGEAPIYFGFGSVFNDSEKDELISIIKKTLNETGKRGILSGMGDAVNLPPSMFMINSIPHDWLFDKVKAVCHHGGAGTSAAGFRSGVPSIIIPFSNDQFAWAHRAYDLGIGSKPISRKKLNSKALSEAINYAMSPDVINKSKEIGDSIKKENGAYECAKIIVRLL